MKTIASFKDLQIFNNTYRDSLTIMLKILPKLPNCERYDLKDQLSRSCKAIPRLIAEGYAKRHQKFGFQKYLDDALAETNETIVSLEQVRDIYRNLIDNSLIDILISNYNVSAKQIFTLRKTWKNFN